MLAAVRALPDGSGNGHRRVSLSSLDARMVLALSIALAAGSAAAQAPAPLPGAMDTNRVAGGAYAVDSGHTQILFTVNHLGFNSYFGIFGGATGTLTIDPKKPNAASVEISVPMSGITTTSPELNTHLAGADFFDAAKFPVATFKSTGIAVTGMSAKVDGTLTLRGVTRPIVLDMRFTGAGKVPMIEKDAIAFEGTTSIRRSDFGMGYGVPMVSDVVPLRITAAFEKK
jgi:polyisoprenoid-binding protein YceI